MRNRTKDWSASSLIYEVFDYGSILHHEQKVRERFKDFVDTLPKRIVNVVDNSAFIGVEVEVEGIKNRIDLKSLLYPMWEMVKDGSLRSNGMEFVSVPMRGETIYKSLYLLKYFLEKTNKISFSERTSIHVHMNVRRLSIEQIFVLVLTYLIVEKVLFRFVEKCGFTRENNIFCVPITDSKYYLRLNSLFSTWNGGQFSNFFSYLSSFWRKYTAFNVLPLNSKGTIEFRHMGGTLDLQILMDWINLILSLKRFAYKTPLKKLLTIVENLNTDSAYMVFLESVFPQHNHLLWESGSDTKLEEGVISVKQCIVWSNSKEKEEICKSLEEFEQSSFGLFLSSLGIKFEDAGQEIEELKLRLEKLKLEKKQIETGYSPDKDEGGILATRHAEIIEMLLEIEAKITQLTTKT